MTSAVSGALDRLQGEADPCCKYDTSKKTWQYLHLGRASEDFGKVFLLSNFFEEFHDHDFLFATVRKAKTEQNATYFLKN